MPRKYAKSTKRFTRTKRTFKRYNKYRRTGYRILARRISAVSKRVAGEVCKFEITPEVQLIHQELLVIQALCYTKLVV